jgi:cytochrome c oxidase cbb3-type subunit 2
MPTYALLNKPLDTTYSERKMKLLNFPYTQADLDDLKGKTEMDAMIAYMRKLGTDIPVKKAEAAVQSPVAVTTNPFKDVKAVEVEANAIYKQQCASCHGENREGTLGPALKGSAKSDAELFTIISKGVEANGMPPYGTSLGDQKIWKMVTYIKLGTK